MQFIFYKLIAFFVFSDFSQIKLEYNLFLLTSFCIVFEEEPPSLGHELATEGLPSSTLSQIPVRSAKCL